MHAQRSGIDDFIQNTIKTTTERRIYWKKKDLQCLMVWSVSFVENYKEDRVQVEESEQKDYHLKPN
jgi:hypothetical protein